MGLSYSNQSARYVIGSASVATTLTATYAGSVTVPLGGMSQAILYCVYTPKAAEADRTMSVKVEFSFDGGTIWVPLSKGADAAVASNIIVTTVYDSEFAMAGAAGGTQYEQRIPVSVGEYGVGTPVLMRVQVKEDGTENFGTATVVLSLSGR